MGSRAWAADASLAAVVAVGSVLFALPNFTASALGVALSASLAVRRVVPWCALALATAAAVAQAALLSSLTVSTVVVPLLVHTYARWSTPALWRTSLGIALAGAVAGPVWWLNASPPSHVLVTVAAYSSVVVLAHVTGARSRERAEQQARRERDLIARRHFEVAAAKAQERNEIAREVHDVVAHSLATIAVQAEGGRAAVRRRPERAAEVLEVIADESRTALAEIRDLVGLLRRGDLRRLDPGLDGVRDLVGRLGPRARLRVEGDAQGPMPAHTVYRVVQESLTNFLRHAGPRAVAEVAVTVSEHEVEVVVRDDGRGAHATSDGKGHGLASMRERVLAAGGTMTAAPLPRGGFEVRVLLPAGAGT
jgi:signal transduction histidine kinase